MKHFKSLIILTSFCTTLLLQAQTGREIAQMVKDRPNGDTRYSELTMTLINKRGSKRERKLISYSIDVGKNKKDTKTIMFFLYPGDVKGTGFLTWDYDDIEKEDDKWLYLPAMKKTRRISGTSAKTDYFMGSDFTYDDMSAQNIDEYTHKLLGEETINEHQCWVLESKPKDHRALYSVKKAWIRKDCLIADCVEFYDKMGKLHRKLQLSEINQIDGFWIAQRLEMINIQTNHQTILEIKNPQFNLKIDEHKFTVNTLEKGRF